MTYDMVKSFSAPLHPVNKEEVFFTHVLKRFHLCQENLNRDNKGYGFYSCVQIESSEYLPEFFSKQRLQYFFDKSYCIFEKSREEIGYRTHDFVAINPIQSRKIYYNKNIKVFNYIEIHTKGAIYACLYDVSDYKEGSPNNFFNTPYSTNAVARCLKLTTCIGRYELPAEDLSTALLDKIRDRLGSNMAGIEDFEFICRQPNGRFLLCCLAYSVLAFNCERFECLRDDICVPFLLVADCSSVSDNKPVSANNEILAYVKRIYGACCMPNGAYSEGFPLKGPKEYEAHINKQQNAGKITLIVHDEKAKSTTKDKPSEASNIREGFPEFYRIIDRTESEKQFYPYTSLPFIVATNKADFPEKYFLKFDTGEIGEIVKADEANVMGALTRIVQSACVSLSQISFPLNLLNKGDLNLQSTSFDPSNKRGADLIYLTRILRLTVVAMFGHKEAMQKNVDRESISRLAGSIINSIRNRPHLLSLESPVSKEHSEKSPVNRLLQHIAKDLAIGGVFTEDKPNTPEDYANVKFAFIYYNSDNDKTLLCFRRPKYSQENTFEAYIQDRLSANEISSAEIWKVLGNTQEFSGLTYRNKGVNYYRYPALDAQVHAFDIAAVKNYLDKQKTS